MSRHPVDSVFRVGEAAYLEELQPQTVDADEEPEKSGLVGKRAGQHGLRRLDRYLQADEIANQVGRDRSLDPQLVEGPGWWIVGLLSRTGHCSTVPSTGRSGIARCGWTTAAGPRPA